METGNSEYTNQLVNLSSFSALLGKEFNIPDTVFLEHILCMVSLSMAHSNKNVVIDELTRLYEKDAHVYYDAFQSSHCKNNVLLSLGSLAMEDFAHKILGLLLVSENDFNLRRQLIRIISNLNPNIYRTVIKHNFKYFKLEYKDFHDFIYSEEAKYDRAVFLYLSFYCSPDWVDQNLLYAITHSIYQQECFHPIHADISKEIKGDSYEIERIQKEILSKHGEIRSYEDILLHSNNELAAIGNVFENLFYLNKLDLKDIYSSINNNSLSASLSGTTEYLNEIYLAIIKQDKYSFNFTQKLYLYISCLFISPFIREYQRAKAYFFEHSKEKYDMELVAERNENLRLQKELAEAKKELDVSKKELQHASTIADNSIHSAKKGYEAQLSSLNRTLSALSEELEEEKSYRLELNKLREYMFSLDIPITPSEDQSISLKDYLFNKRIIIVGGPRQWRRRLREAFPFLDTLSGTSTSFDLSIFTQIDCVLFYTNYMSHSIYHRAMNYIRTNHLKFGYLKSTNIQLIEFEIIEVLKQCDVIK